MTPYYFPFTCFSETAASALRACFRSMVVYQSSRIHLPEAIRKGVADGFVDLRVPGESGTGRLERVMKAYRQWADLHRGERFDTFRLRQESIPFYGDMSTSRIRADIRNIQPDPLPDPFFEARLFLQIAQEFDARSDELDVELARLDKTNRELLQQLHGGPALNENRAADQHARRPAPQGDYMIPERLAAWTHLYQCEQARKMHETAPLFITTAQSVLDTLLERTPAAVRVFRFEFSISDKDDQRIRARQRYLSERIDALAGGAGDGPGERPSSGEKRQTGPEACLSVFIAPGEAPQAFFSRISGVETDRIDDQAGCGRAENTLFGQIKCYNL